MYVHVQCAMYGRTTTHLFESTQSGYVLLEDVMEDLSQKCSNSQILTKAIALLCSPPILHEQVKACVDSVLSCRKCWYTYLPRQCGVVR